MTVRIAIIAGSNRGNSSSTKALKYIARLLEGQGVRVDFVHLWAKPLPMYSPDGDQDSHPHVVEMVRAVEAADGLVLGSPEYHGSISGVLKNALDFIDSDIVRGKPVLSLSSSGGAVGVSSLTHMQAIVRNLHGINSPEWISLGGDARKFDESGVPIDGKARLRIERAVNTLLMLVRQLRPDQSEVCV
jgi:azobenzene reductase